MSLGATQVEFSGFSGDSTFLSLQVLCFEDVCRVGGKSCYAVASCYQRGNETRHIGRKPRRVGKK